MMNPLVSIPLAFLLCSTLATARAADGDDALKVVKKKLEETKAEDLLQLRPTIGEALAKTFPGRDFVSGYIPTFPVARLAPEDSGVSSHNLFIVKDGKVEKRLSGTKELETFFQKSVETKKAAEQIDAAKAWLLLAEAFHQDGFYKFAPTGDSFKIAPAEKNGAQASGQMVAMAGGNGTVGIVLTFDAAGKVVSAAETSKLRPGPRPICHATKLLDPDPLIRAIVEQDLLIMGRAAKPYLDERRAKARPELQRAIDRMWQRILKEEE